jgi:hypothetical protein
MGYVSPDDLLSESTNMLDQTGIAPDDVGAVVNQASLLNQFVPGSMIPDASVPQSSPATAPTAAATTTIWSRFVAWLDATFGLNLGRT